jgi:hypothetical protein
MYQKQSVIRKKSHLANNTIKQQSYLHHFGAFLSEYRALPPIPRRKPPVATQRLMFKLSSILFRL